MSTHHARFLDESDRQREQAERLMLAGAGVLLVGLIMIVSGNLLVGAFHLSARDAAYLWLILPGVASALFGGLLSFFSLMASLV